MRLVHVVALGLAGCSGSSSPPATTSPEPEPVSTHFRYDASTGTCVDGAGTPGFNPVDADALFGSPDTATNTWAGVDAECVDFTDFDFNERLGQGYPTLAAWNLRGARFTRASFVFANMIDVDLAGADLREFRIGYTKIDGTGDAHTQLGDHCTAGEGSAVSCFR